MIKSLPPEENFLAVPEAEFYEYEKSHYVIQQVPYEHTSSYLQGSSRGPLAIIKASHFVEFYDEMLDMETYRHGGIATLPPMELGDKVDAAAIAAIEAETDRHLNNGKYIISLGAEHTVTLGF